MKIGPRGDQGPEAVFRQALEVDPPRQRFRQLLVLIDNSPGERGVGEKRLPFVRKVGGEIGNDRLAASRRLEVGPGKTNPFEARNGVQTLDLAQRNNRNPRLGTPLRRNVEKVQPDNVNDEAGKKRRPIVRQASEDKPGKGYPVTGKR